MPADFSVIMSRGVQDGIALGQYFRQVGADADRNFQAQFLIGQTEIETAISLGKMHRDSERDNFRRHLEERKLAIAEREQNRLDARFGTSSAPSTFIEDTLGLGAGGGYEPALDWGAGTDMDAVPEVEAIPEPDAYVPTDDEMFAEGYALGSGEVSPEQEERDAERAEAVARGERSPIYSPEGGGKFIEPAVTDEWQGAVDLLGGSAEASEMEAMEAELGAGTQLGAAPRRGVAGAAIRDLKRRSDDELLAIMGEASLHMGGPTTQETRAASALHKMAGKVMQQRAAARRAKEAGETKADTKARRAEVDAFRDESREQTRESKAKATEKDAAEVAATTKVFNSSKEDAVGIYKRNQTDPKVDFDLDLKTEMETAYSTTQTAYVALALPGDYDNFAASEKAKWRNVVDARNKFWTQVRDMKAAAEKLGISTMETIKGLATPTAEVAAPVAPVVQAPNARLWLNQTLKGTRK